MSEYREAYDTGHHLMRIYRAFDEAKTLVPKEEVKKWSTVAREGTDKKGRKVEEVRYVFEDKATAAYNQQPLSFAGLTTFVDEGDGEEPLGDDPEFSVREDFGIE